jgi:sec-independent protein translocase protein TatC
MSETEQAPDGEASFISHLIELRARLLKASIAVLLALVVLLPFANKIYGWLALPLLSHLPQGGSMIATEVASPFLTPLKLAFFVAVMIAAPFVLYQLWAFIAPGLYRHEKRLARPILASSVILFYLGCAFAYFFVLPAVILFMMKIAPSGVAVMPDITHYLSFAVGLFLASGLCFEIPVVVVILVALGVVTPAQLSEHRRYAIAASVVVAAILAPPDALSMILLATAMCFLYELGLIGARVLIRAPATGQAADDSQP